MLTEDEANKMWCPFARVFSMSGALNRDSDGTPHGLGYGGASCVASACMAWRWSTEGRKLGYDQNGHMASVFDHSDTPRGFCGLAGAMR